MGESLKAKDHPWEVYLWNGEEAVETTYVSIAGRVNTPKGAKSILTECETAPAGTRYSFEFLWPKDKRGSIKPLPESEMPKIMGAFVTIGQGSCLSLGYGKLRLVEFEMVD